MIVVHKDQDTQDKQSGATEIHSESVASHATPCTHTHTLTSNAQIHPTQLPQWL